MSFKLEAKDIRLSEAGVGINYLDQTYRLTFQVTSTAASNVVEVTQWLVGQIPWNLTTYNAPYALLQTFSLDAKDDHDPKVFTGLAVYRQKGDANATRVRFGENSYEVVKWKALNKDDKEVAILNSAGDRFGDPLIETEKRQVIYIDKTYSAASTGPTGIASYYNSVNENPIMIADVSVPARGAVILSIQPAMRILAGASYDWRVTFEIEIKGEGQTYDRETLDQGFYYLEAVDESDADLDGIVQLEDSYYRRVRYTSQNLDTGEYEPSTDPVLLDGAGGLLKDKSPGNEKYITFRTKPEKDWHELDLPTSIWGIV